MITTDSEKQKIIDQFKKKLVGQKVKDIILVENGISGIIAIEFADGTKVIGIDNESCRNVLELFDEKSKEVKKNGN